MRTGGHKVQVEKLQFAECMWNFCQHVVLVDIHGMECLSRRVTSRRNSTKRQSSCKTSSSVTTSIVHLLLSFNDVAQCVNRGLGKKGGVGGWPCTARTGGAGCCCTRSGQATDWRGSGSLWARCCRRLAPAQACEVNKPAISLSPEELK